MDKVASTKAVLKVISLKNQFAILKRKIRIRNGNTINKFEIKSYDPVSIIILKKYFAKTVVKNFITAGVNIAFH
ncbi:MAG: hypothetical protein B6D37_09525 [Sphingobacteriales bacterium UTBCD1]|nr:MAG: hypothetical protein B6D37_09525 [Sphingobacteriales bacterium UTBCD1]